MTNGRRFWSRAALLLGLALCALPASGKIDPKNPPEGRFADDWMEVYMGDAKIGYGHATTTRRGSLIDSEISMTLHMGRAEQPIKIGIVQRATETLEGEAVSFETVMDLSGMARTIRGKVNGNRVVITTEQFGVPQKEEHDFPKGALMSWGLYREQMLRGFTPGTKYRVQTYDPSYSLGSALEAEISIGEKEDFKHGDRTLRGQRVTVSLEMPMGKIQTVSWVDDNGTPMKAVIPMPGLGDMVMLTVDEKTALRDFVPPELFMTTVIRVDKPIDFRVAERIRYRLTSRLPGIDLSDVPDTGTQQVLKRSSGEVELIVSRVTPGKAEPLAPSRVTKEMAEYLEANLVMNTADPEVIQVARDAAANETEPYALANRLRAFVNRFISKKSLDVGFATASEVCRKREGDCSEHGVLLAALGRVNGLPSRVAVGIAYVPIFGGQDDIFGYHMWTQFFIDGVWHDYDAAINEERCSPIRIAFAVSSLKDTGMADLSLGLINKIGGIDLKILEIETTTAEPRPQEASGEAAE